MKSPSHTLALGILGLAIFAPATLHGQKVEQPASQPVVQVQTSGLASHSEEILLGLSLAVVIGAYGATSRDHKITTCPDIGC